MASLGSRTLVSPSGLYRYPPRTCFKGLFPLTATARSRVIASGGALQGHRRGPVAACRPCWSIGGPTAPGDRTRRVLGARYSGHLGRRKRRQPAARPHILHTRRHDRDERARCRVMVQAACEGRLWPQQVHQTDLKACRRRAVVARAETAAEEPSAVASQRLPGSPSGSPCPF